MSDSEDLDELESRLRKWETTTLKDALKALPERRKDFVTTSSRSVRRLYTPLDLRGKSFADRLGNPGEFPFTRGIHPTMYRGRLWTMRMFAGYGSAEDTNRRFKYLIAHGETGLSVAFDMPTLYGYDTDAPEAKGEFGTCGVAVSSLEDMQILFRDIDVGSISTSMTINAPADVVWAMYLGMAESRGVPLPKLRGTIQNDILKEYEAQKEWIFPPEQSMRLVVDTFEFGAQEAPQWNTISISGYHIREAGATAGQELAFTLANGMEYVRWGVDRGLKVDAFAPRLSFFFNAHNDLFEEIAKYRAARRIWAREMRDTFGAKSPRSWLLRTHAQTAGVSLTAQQPEVNIVRTTIQALAAVLGGTQSLHTNSYDEAYQVPNEKAVRIALRTQQILAHESGVANTVDPLGGSYYLESLTDELEEEAYRYFDRIQDMGGVIAAIRKGFIQQEIANSAYRYQREIEDKERIIVGVNDFVVDEQPEVEPLRVAPASLKAQLERLRRIRSGRDRKKWERSLDGLRKACEDPESNTMPRILDAVRARATLGEICGVMREVFGVWEEPLLY
ncbi:MAG TPA: methylmalonyl-CoA mutase family protein [Thermoplasmata archaeon]|nr:methylmalonyl-CoA mutase family protein [Thermoplasmata archaeon]